MTDGLPMPMPMPMPMPRTVAKRFAKKNKALAFAKWSEYAVQRHRRRLFSRQLVAGNLATGNWQTFIVPAECC